MANDGAFAGSAMGVFVVLLDKHRDFDTLVWDGLVHGSHHDRVLRNSQTPVGVCGWFGFSG